MVPDRDKNAAIHDDKREAVGTKDNGTGGGE
jgi:hypothetical protein